MSARSPLPSPVHLVTHLRWDAAVYEPAAEEVRAHLGVETQESPLAILRTTPARIAVFAIIVLSFWGTPNVLIHPTQTLR